MSVPEWRNALCKSGLKPTDRHVARAIAEYWKADGTCDDAYPSIRTLAGNTGLSETTVRRAIRSLEKAGFIVTSFRSRGGVENRYSAATPILAPTPGLDDANPGAGDGVNPVIHDLRPGHPRPATLAPGPAKSSKREERELYGLTAPFAEHYEYEVEAAPLEDNRRQVKKLLDRLNGRIGFDDDEQVGA